MKLGAMVRFFTLLAALGIVLTAASADVERARKLFNSTDFEQSLKILQSVPKDAEAYALIGRNYYMLGEFKKSSEALQKAVDAAPNDSHYALWLGRAYGRRAETSNPLTAPGYASKTRQYFERAAQLNPRDVEALSDLLDYYLEAPGFLGGGMDKAEATANRIAALDAAEGHDAQARVAQKRKQYRTAEEQLQRALESAPRQVGRLVAYARFLSGRGRFDEAEQSLAKAQAIAPDSPQLLFDRASIYVEAHRNLKVAKELLKRYLSLPLTADNPSRYEAEKLLRQAEGG